MFRAGAVVVLGCYVCVLSSVVYQHRIAVGPVELPWGIALGVATTYAVAVAAGIWVSSGPALLAVGWGAGLIAPMAAPTESFLIVQDAWGWAFVLASAAALLVAYLQQQRRERT